MPALKGNAWAVKRGLLEDDSSRAGRSAKRFAANVGEGASCVSQIRTAQAVREDFGEAEAARCGVDQWAVCDERHSERDASRIIQKQGSTLGFQLESMSIHGKTIPWINPRTWLEFLLKKGLWARLAGAPNDNVAGQVWSQFWKTYQKICPSHQIFALDNVDFEATAAFAIHGDEGRTLKKQGLLVTSIQSCLGHGFTEKRVAYNPGGEWKPLVNFVSHSYTHRFVTSVIPKQLYDFDPGLFHAAMESLAIALNDLMVTGARDPMTGRVYRIAVIACKGDAPYLAKAGRFYRAFNTQAKRGDERREPKGICHRCLAGLTSFPAEEIGTPNPKWWSTKVVKLPWTVVPEFLKHLMHDEADPSSFFQSDIWHTVHLGFGRSWCASVITLTLEVIQQPNLDLKWSFLTVDYQAWCKGNKKQCHITAITAHLVSYNDKTGCQGNWHKGAVTTNMMKWIMDLLGRLPEDSNGLLRACRHATRLMNEIFSILYRADAFLTAEQCRSVSRKGLEYLRVYSCLAGQAMALPPLSETPYIPRDCFDHQKGRRI